MAARRNPAPTASILLLMATTAFTVYAIMLGVTAYMSHEQPQGLRI
jgi:hypothetical protein